MQKIKKYIIIIIAIIILLLGIVFMLNSKTRQIEKEYDINPEEVEKGDNVVLDTSEKKLTNPTFFYTVESCIQKYCNYATMDLEKKYAIKDENGNEEYASYDYSLAQGITSEEERNNVVYNMLSSSYIKEKNITKTNLRNLIDKEVKPVIFTALQMNAKEEQRMKVYSVYGKIESQYDSEFREYVYFIVTLDDDNMTFMIEPIEKKYKNINEIEIKKEVDEIQKNDNNTYTYVRINDTNLVNKYISFYKTNCFKDAELVYECLNKQYREKRFGDVEEFKKYLAKNEEMIRNVIISKYKKIQEDGITQYVALDTNGNYYIFDETATMQFSLCLDTYTLENEKFKEDYEKADEQNKVMMNIDKWVQMINNRDYHAAYQVLDETFRNNSFKSEEDFEEYMRNYFPLFYEVEFKEFEKETGVFIQTVVFKGNKGEKDTPLERTFVMKLEEGTEFVMSMNLYKH